MGNADHRRKYLCLWTPRRIRYYQMRDRKSLPGREDRLEKAGKLPPVPHSYYKKQGGPGPRVRELRAPGGPLPGSLYAWEETKGSCVCFPEGSPYQEIR